MMFAVLCAFLVAGASAAPVEPWWGEPNKMPQYACGSTAPGAYHSYEDNFRQHGYVRKVEVWGGEIIDAIRMTHGDEPEGPKVGGTGGIPQGSFTLKNDEYITGVDIEYEQYLGRAVICRLTFVTGLGRYGPYGLCRHDGFCGERTFTSPLQYVNVMYEEFITWMSFTW